MGHHLTEFHIAGRGEGKTLNALMWMAQNPDAVLVYPDKRQAEHAWRMGMHLGFERVLDDRRFISLDNLHHGFLRGGTYKIGIENLDLLLHRITEGRTIHRATMTGRTPHRLWRYEDLR